jgi:ADP-heptose:LPS heptosyltransferase
LHALRERYPDAHIDVLVRPGCAALFESNSDASRVLTYDSPRFPQKKGSRGAGLFRTLALIHRLRSQQYDIAIDARGDDIARLLLFFSRVPMRLGPDRIFMRMWRAQLLVSDDAHRRDFRRAAPCR